MSIPITLPGMHGPAAGFDEPFELLAGCHDRVRRSLTLLKRLADRVASEGADAKAQAAARDVLRYFDLAAPAHHEDEERHVVPLLAASADPTLVAAASRLLQDHEAIRAAWQSLRPLLLPVAEAARCDDDAALAAAAERFISVHDGHLELEDGLVFPAAARLHPDHAAMGREMAQRRGVDTARKRGG
ncbi:MAG: hemerythrin domain-containing protein [Ideonella sp.]|nr:hemerythrin domain-containing protein [Ideonella sp.]